MLQENFETLVKLFEAIQEDYAKAVTYNKSAARRTRVNSSKMMKLLKQFRKDISENLYTKPE